MNTTKCKSCGAEIIWAKTAKGKNTPLDAKPVRIAELIEDPETGEEVTEEGRYLIAAGHTGHTSHWATCPSAEQHRRPR